MAGNSSEGLNESDVTLHSEETLDFDDDTLRGEIKLLKANSLIIVHCPFRSSNGDW